MELALSRQSICTKTVSISSRELCPKAHHSRRCSNNLWDLSTRKENEFVTRRLTTTRTRLRRGCRGDAPDVCDREVFSCYPARRRSMRFKLGLGLALAMIFAVAVSLPVWAHHSHGNYNTDTFIDIEGVVKELHLVVPHSWVYLEVKDDKGEPQVWALEATGRTGLERIGVTREYVKPGDTVKARCHLLRDGTNGCLLGFLKAKDGTVKDWDGNNAKLPTDF